MMNYDIFKEVVAEKIKDYLPENLRGMDIKACPTQKVNVELDAISLVNNEMGQNISPTIYINHMYDEYKRTGDLERCLSNAANLLAKGYADRPESIPNLRLEEAKDSIVFQLINTEQNKEMLADMPNRSFQDLSIIYRWVVNKRDDGIESTVINNTLAKTLGVSEEQLFKLAVENTKRIFPPVVKSMNDVIREMFMADGMPAELAEMMIGDMPEDRTMWVITNTNGINGAVSMLYENNLHELAEQLETDLYIMPSSLHEVIAVSVNMGDPNELAEMVTEINMEQVRLEDRLSNQVYHYDKDLRKLTLATDTPNKRIDGIVAEAQLVYDATEKAR